MNFCVADAVARPHSREIQLTFITDASYQGSGANLENERIPLLCVSRRLTRDEHSYKQGSLGDESSSKVPIQYPAQDLDFTNNPNQTLARNSVAMA